MTTEPINVGLQMLWDEFVTHMHDKRTTRNQLADDKASFRAAYLVTAGNNSDDAWIACICYKMATDAYCENLEQVLGHATP